MKFIKITDNNSIGRKRQIIIEIFGIKISFKFKYMKPLLYRSQRHKKVELAVVAILKNEAAYIREWLEYHMLIGVERFYLYDNESNDNVVEILEPYIKKGIVIYKYIKGRCKQIPVYNDVIYRYKNEIEWLAIIDLDEYIVPIEKNNLIDFLRDYTNFSGVGINSIMFDSNGYLTKPDLLTIEAYTRRRKNIYADNRVVKSIIKPKDVKCNYNPHFCEMKKNKYIVDSNYEVVQYGCSNSCNIDKVRINHYHTKSWEEYCEKTSKGFADQKTIRTIKKERFDFIEDTEMDYSIYKYLPQLKIKMTETSTDIKKESSFNT